MMSIGSESVDRRMKGMVRSPASDFTVLQNS